MANKKRDQGPAERGCFVRKIASLPDINSAISCMCLLGLIAFETSAVAEPTVFTDRETFDRVFPTVTVNDFTNPAYQSSQTDAEMNAVGDDGVTFQATGFANSNLVMTSPENGSERTYCSGCNGSFRVALANTAAGEAAGAAGFAIGIFDNGNFDGADFENSFVACVKFASGVFRELSLPTPELGLFGSGTSERAFWGVEAPPGDLISHIDFGGPCGADGIGTPTIVGVFIITNLTVGNRVLFASGFE